MAIVGDPAFDALFTLYSSAVVFWGVYLPGQGSPYLWLIQFFMERHSLHTHQVFIIRKEEAKIEKVPHQQK